VVQTEVSLFFTSILGVPSELSMAMHLSNLVANIFGYPSRIIFVAPHGAKERIFNLTVSLKTLLLCSPNESAQLATTTSRNPTRFKRNRFRKYPHPYFVALAVEVILE